MKVVALVSGGKDSCYAMMKCIQYGHQIVAVANLMPADDSVDELDSYMYQTVGHQIVVSYAECMGVPLFRRRIQGSTRHQKLTYRMTPGDEVEDMFILLKEVKRQIPSVTAVSSGAIASDYQRLRVESVCSTLGLVSLAYLWKQDQSLLLQEMYFRFYFPTSLPASLDAPSLMLTNAFNEFAEMNRDIKIGKDPIFNLVPVLGAGKSSASMDDIITCELLARK